MKKMPTAEEYIWRYDFIDNFLSSKTPTKDLENFLINFAKLHVQQALKEASKKSKKKEGQITDHKLTNSILNSYSLENIK
jgi:hypothetical protein